MKLKRFTASLLTLIMLLSSVCVCFAADSNYDKIKNYVDKIAPNGEITISDLSNTLKVGTSSSDLKAEDISVRRNTDLTYSSSLDMSDVRTKYETIMTAINLLDTELKDIVNNSNVSGEFVIDITYDEKLDISAITENKFTELNNEIFDAENISVTYPAKGSMQIQVKIGADKKVSNVSADKLSDITYRVSNVKTTENGGPYAVKVSMNGYVAFNADNKEYARIKFTSPETVRNVTVYTQSSGGRRPSNTNKTLKFDSDGGSNIPDQKIASGSNASVPAAPTKEGFTFEGWYTDAELTKPYDFNSKVTENITLYAKWTKIDETQNKSEIIVKGLKNKELILNDDKTVDFSKLETPTRDGFIFGGWYTDENCQNRLTEETVIEDGNIYGKWINNRTPALLNAADHIAYINGYPDKTVKPENNITREEVAAIIYRLMNEDAQKEFSSKEPTFTDISKSDWSYESVAVAAAAGLISGYEDSTFRPGNAITRAEFAAMLSRLYTDIDISYATDFNDIHGHWAENDIKKLSALECISGYEDGTFRPEQLITRAEAIVIINRILVRYANHDGISSNANTWADNGTDKWYYYPVLEATNAHDYSRAADQYNENWN